MEVCGSFNDDGAAQASIKQGDDWVLVDAKQWDELRNAVDRVFSGLAELRMPKP
jgi:hypothetical protein